jgi:hypothetical protein
VWALEVLDRQNWERERQIEAALGFQVAVRVRLDCCRFGCWLGVVVLRVFVVVVFLWLVQACEEDGRPGIWIVKVDSVLKCEQDFTLFPDRPESLAARGRC